jgi:hypothetical protein
LRIYELELKAEHGQCHRRLKKFIGAFMPALRRLRSNRWRVHLKPLWLAGVSNGLQ